MSGVGRYCCRSRKSKNSKNLAKVDSSMFSLRQGLVGSIRRPVIDLVRNDVVPHVAACRTHERTGQSKKDFFHTIEG